MLKKGRYKHYKGSEYEVLGVARHSETLEELVVYLDSNQDFWVRPLSMFIQDIEVDGKKIPRFEYTGETSEKVTKSLSGKMGGKMGSGTVS